MEPIVSRFLDYEKISDTLLYMSQDTLLKFNVLLGRRRQDGSRSFFSREAQYKPKQYDFGVSSVISVKRDMQFYFSIDDKNDFTNSILLRPNDVVMLTMLMNNIVLPWFIGKTRIFGKSPDDGKIIIKGKWKEVPFIMSDIKYMKFYPMICQYEDGRTLEGVRIEINDPSNGVDLNVNQFFTFYYYITKTDMYSSAIGLINYISQTTMGINRWNADNQPNDGRAWDAYGDKEKSGPSFFDKL